MAGHLAVDLGSRHCDCDVRDVVGISVVGLEIGKSRQSRRCDLKLLTRDRLEIEVEKAMRETMLDERRR